MPLVVPLKMAEAAKINAPHVSTPRRAPVEFTLGADPEFLLSKEGNVVDSEDALGSRDLESPFGGDIGGVLTEVRPAPSQDPIVVARNIHSIFSATMRDKPNLVKDYSWIAGSYNGGVPNNGVPMGGHIHFGGLGSESQPRCRYLSIDTANSVLDNYVGAVSLLIEDPQEGKARRDHIHRGQNGVYRYGRPSDRRPNAWGWEYRTPSSWLVSPSVAAAMLCLAKTVIYEAVNNPAFSFGQYTTRDNFLKMETHALRAKRFPLIWRDIGKMMLYPNHKQHLDFIHHLITNRLSWFPKAKSMKQAWGVVGDSIKPLVFRGAGEAYTPIPETGARGAVAAGR